MDGLGGRGGERESGLAFRSCPVWLFVLMPTYPPTCHTWMPPALSPVASRPLCTFDQSIAKPSSLCPPKVKTGLVARGGAAIVSEGGEKGQIMSTAQDPV